MWLQCTESTQITSKYVHKQTVNPTLPCHHWSLHVAHPLQLSHYFSFPQCTNGAQVCYKQFSYYLVKALNKPSAENDQTCACKAYLVHSSSCYWPAKWIQPDIHRAMKLLHLAAIWYMGWTKALEFVNFDLYTNTHTHKHVYIYIIV